MKLKKLSLMLAIIMFIGFGMGVWASSTPSRHLRTPDCASIVFVDLVYTDFFRYFVWHNRSQIDEAVRNDILYWSEFQGLLVKKFGFLRDPPMELVLKKILCPVLGRRNLTATSIEDPKLIQWFQTVGTRVVQEIRKHSLKTRDKLLRKEKLVVFQAKEQRAFDAHVDIVRKQVAKDYFEPVR